ncbi:unnamed protein product, partial [Iphiclides podalirius]
MTVNQSAVLVIVQYDLCPPGPVPSVLLDPNRSGRFDRAVRSRTPRNPYDSRPYSPSNKVQNASSTARALADCADTAFGIGRGERLTAVGSRGGHLGALWRQT